MSGSNGAAYKLAQLPCRARTRTLTPDRVSAARAASAYTNAGRPADGGQPSAPSQPSAARVADSSPRPASKSSVPGSSALHAPAVLRRQPSRMCAPSSGAIRPISAA